MIPRGHEKTTRRMAGFTLLELLVALMLLGLISTLALGGVRLGARTWETVSQRAGENGRMQMVRAFLARELAQAVPVYVPDGGRKRRLAYDGDRESLVFVAPLAPHFGLGGFQRLELSVDDDEDPAAGKRLILKRRRYHRADGLDAPAEEEDDEIHLLLDGVEEVRFAYRESARDGAVTWSDAWRDRDSLPALMRLRVTFTDSRRAAWPDLLVAGRITTQPGCLTAERGVGCRNR